MHDIIRFSSKTNWRVDVDYNLKKYDIRKKKKKKKKEGNIQRNDPRYSERKLSKCMNEICLLRSLKSLLLSR